jgi:SM-20-related protein
VADVHGEQLVDMQAFAATPLVQDPFPHLVVKDFVPEAAMVEIMRDFPEVPDRGSFPMSELQSGPVFKELVAYLQRPEVAKAFSEKLGVDLTGRPTTVTIRGFSGAKDGRVHTDSRSKLVTVLLYLNSGWTAEAGEGQLRLLRSDNLDDWFDEVPPEAGTLLVFVNTTNAWHGHKPFIGPRRSIQLNWVVDDAAVRRSAKRHGLSARIKRWFGKGTKGAA